MREFTVVLVIMSVRNAIVITFIHVKLRLFCPSGFYMTIPRASVQHQGDWAWLESPRIEGSEETTCISFW